MATCCLSAGNVAPSHVALHTPMASGEVVKLALYDTFHQRRRSNQHQFIQYNVNPMKLDRDN
ncbi:hypothetical protein DTO96_102466 [Ephemeroptericola cinctiostellae]|uniref:Uncharacterized protein n=1 Tax=Ephemeroptericola cinctiostellae TaxID=2268024 RepID=A0A345DEC2_9BURK|nr:hypothetical protein [Ephemeroptericola cinctiostellae]AXF86710.1 hypothetical protein DTO96_102466 [Ephemeroptericola cinctiostellae]